MSALALLLVTVTAPQPAFAAAPDKPAAPAQVVITAELACLHCDFGEGESCAVCLKLDDKTPVRLAGKAAKQFEELRLDKKVLVAEGTLSVGKDKRLVLTSDKAHLYTDKDKGKVPEKGQALVVGVGCCGKCDLDLCDECTLAVRNDKQPIVLDGKLATQHAEEGKGGRKVTATGKLFVDKRGLLRLDAKAVKLDKADKQEK